MVKASHIKACKNIEEFNNNIKNLSPKIGKLGGRSFHDKSGNKYSLNQIVITFAKLADNSKTTESALKNIDNLNRSANIKLHKKNAIVKALTFLRQFIGNINFNKNKILQRISDNYRIKKADLARGSSVSLKPKVHEPVDDSNVDLRPNKINYDKISLSSLKKKHDEILKQKQKINPDLPVLISSKNRATMEGISIAADYLAEKHKIDNLFVCASLKAFQGKLEEIKSGTEDIRLALIVPTYSSFGSPDKKAELSVHKVAVCIERVKGKTKICLIDPGPIKHNASIDPSHINLHENSSFNEQELVFAYMREANFPNATYYCVKPIREHSQEGGCSTFALRDALVFIKDARFFDRVEKKGKINRLEEKGSLVSPFYIRNLPPHFMRIAQSLRLIDMYIETNIKESLFNVKKKLGPTKKPFKEDVELHTRTTTIYVDDGYDRAKLVKKLQNKALDDKLKKYQMVINYFLEIKTPEELLKLIEKRMIR